jgi:membrane-bound ClpP family serine protease
LDDAVRIAIEARKAAPNAPKRDKLAVVLETNGGIIEVVERMVLAIRHHYPSEVIMIVPNRAMSAGTVFALSGDRIMMDYFSCLGPIDPQVQRNGKFVPALSYLVQYERLIEKSKKGTLTTAEMVLLQQLDLAELHSFEEARELSNTLLKEWLAKYKFKDWKKTESHGTEVTGAMREERALEVAEKLMNHQLWHSHSRPISMEVLHRDIKLKIEDFGSKVELAREIKEYQQFLADYMRQIGIYCVVHANGTCLKWN